MYRFESEIEVLLVHPGGPLNRSKDEGSWSIPKGEFNVGEETSLQTAIREFQEELGSAPPATEFIRLKPVIQKSGKVVHAYAVEGDLDTTNIRCNNFEMEWPPRSGKTQEFPEIDRAEWFNIPTARRKANPAQTALLDELLEKVGEKAE